jgi:curved DNA-binding protein CbpA
MEHLDHLRPEASLRQPGTAAGPSHYRVLDVAPNASRMQIREAYLRLKNTYGAGSAALYSLISEEEANEQMAQVEEAFRVLNDETARRDYDRQLGVSQDGLRQGALGGDYGLGGSSEFAMPEGEFGADATTVRTVRATLPIIKLKANRAGSDEVKDQMQAIIDSSDPGDGDLFRRLRELCEVTEDEMQDRIKVSVGYIKAIEGNRFDRLPQVVYVKGFLRSYCRYLCVPEAEKLVTAFAARLSDWQANRKA